MQEAKQLTIDTLDQCGYSAALKQLPFPTLLHDRGWCDSCQLCESILGDFVMFCIHCGAVNAEDSNNCAKCGQALFSGQAPHTQQMGNVPAHASEPVTPTEPTTSKFRGVSTKQMVVLWYGAIAIITVLIFSGSTFAICAALIVATGILVFSFSRQPRVSKKSVFLGVALPIIGAVAIAAASLYSSNTSSRLFKIPISSIDLFDLRLGLNSSCGDITGRVRNRSEKIVKSIKLRVTLSNQTGPIDGADTSVSVDVPSGQTRSFSGVVCEMKESPGWTWTYTTLEVQGE